MTDWKETIVQLLHRALPQLENDAIRAMIETPADPKLGDYAFPCFRLAKELRKAPPLIAKELAEKLAADPAAPASFEKIEPVNAYLNFFVSKTAFAKDALETAAEMGPEYGRSAEGATKTYIVEYSSPNIAKPFHIGHIRTTVIGAALANIYDALGYNVVRINHLGDYGTQFGKMIVAYRKWGCAEDVKKEPIKTLLALYVKFHEEAEKDPSLEDEARATFARLEQGAKEETELWQWFRDESLKEFGRVYDMLGIRFDSYAGEAFYSDKMDRVVRMMEEKGILEESRGAMIVDLSKWNLTPALIKKSDGSTIYITRDVAAAVYRHETYDFDKCIYVVASQQNLHFQQLFKVLELMGFDWASKCVHVPFGMVSLEDGTLSTRHGRVVFLEDVLNRAVEKTKEIILEKGVATDNVDETARIVGIGAVLFNELSTSRIKDYTFVWDEVLNFDGETGPYVQYTHARCCSVLRKAGLDVSDPDIEALESKADYSKLSSDAAKQLIRSIYDFPAAVRKAGDEYEPSDVTRHVIDVAQEFNKFYHDEHILTEDEGEKAAKLLLTVATKTTIRNGLALLGIQSPQRM